MSLAAGDRFGSYDILLQVGVGGMGQVFSAIDRRLGRKVALKILPAHSTEHPDRVRRFELEARAASALNHPNILTVYEIGEIDGVHFMATEYVEGLTLRSMLGSRMPLDKALDIAVQTAAALAAAHQAGIVHRDIKPENIMVRPDGYVKVLDFGLAKLTEPQTTTADSTYDSPTQEITLTQPGHIVGTWRYMSPEQARGQSVDTRSDIWSFGTVLYEMVTGHAAFGAPTASDTLARILERQPATVEQSGIQAPPELQRILTRALAKDRAERYQNIKDLELDLRQVRRSMDLSSGGLPAISHEAPAARAKRPSLRLAAVIGLLVILAALVVAWWMRHPPTEAVSPLLQLEITYRIYAQKLRNGKPYGEEFPASGQQVFDNSWRIRMDFVSPQAGSLYVLDEGQTRTGGAEWSFFFPLPATNGGLAQLAAGQKVATDWARFEQIAGTEKFWIVYSAKPVSELEDTLRAVSNPQEMGVIHDSQRVAAIAGLLARSRSPAPELIVEKATGQTTIRAHGELVAGELDLEHR